MPRVGRQNFSYTPSGIQAATAAASRKMLKDRKPRGARRKSVAMTRALFKKP